MTLPVGVVGVAASGVDREKMTKKEKEKKNNNKNKRKANEALAHFCAQRPRGSPLPPARCSSTKMMRNLVTSENNRDGKQQQQRLRGSRCIAAGRPADRVAAISPIDAPLSVSLSGPLPSGSDGRGEVRRQGDLRRRTGAQGEARRVSVEHAETEAERRICRDSIRALRHVPLPLPFLPFSPIHAPLLLHLCRMLLARQF